MLICTCGKMFKTIKIGDVIIYGGSLYSCDTKECPGCSKRVVEAASLPICSMAETERVDKIIACITEKGHNVYGAKGGE